MVWDCWQAPEDSVSHGLWKQRLEGVSTKNKTLWEPLFESLSGKGVRVPATSRWQQQTPLKTLLLCSLYDFKTWKALAHDLVPASLCGGPIFYFMLSQ